MSSCRAMLQSAAQSAARVHLTPRARPSIAKGFLTVPRRDGEEGCRSGRWVLRAEMSGMPSQASPSATATTPAPDLNKKKITGPTIVIAGGSQGSGRAIAIEAAKRGMNVVLAARSEGPLDEAAETVRMSLRGGYDKARVLPVRCDITKDEDVERLQREVLATFESIDLVACVAGVCCTGPFESTTLEDHRSQMDVNFMGHVAVTQAFLPSLMRTVQAKGKGAAALVVVNSFVARLPIKYMSAYTASKYALAGWTDAIRMELDPQGINVCQVHPGVIASDFMSRAMFRGADSEKSRESLDQVLTSPLAQKPQEIADAVFKALDGNQKEVVVGPVYKAAVESYRLTGVNVGAFSPR